MAYQKLQTYQAIQVIPDNNITIPAPNEVASGTTNGTGAGLLIDGSAKFLTTASVGDVVTVWVEQVDVNKGRIALTMVKSDK